MATFQSQYPWSPGQAALGAHTVNQPLIVTGQMQKQGGIRSFPPSITTPGTIASAGTVQNSTGYDCVVYASAVNGITSVKVLSYNGAVATAVSLPGSIGVGQTGQFLVPGPGAVAVTYAGTLSWAWQPV